MGRGSSTQASDILYGRVQSRAQAEAVIREGTAGALNPLDEAFFRETYFQDTFGFSGTARWIVKTSELPVGWFDKNDNLNTILATGPNVLQSILDADGDAYLESGYQLVELDAKDVDPRLGAELDDAEISLSGLRTQRKNLGVSLREVQAIETLSGEKGEWRYFEQLLDDKATLVYYNSDRDKILGAIWCLHDN